MRSTASSIFRSCPSYSSPFSFSPLISSSSIFSSSSSSHYSTFSSSSSTFSSNFTPFDRHSSSSSSNPDSSSLHSHSFFSSSSPSPSPSPSPPSDPPIENVVIIGSGAAGLTAAIYNSRANLSPLVIEGEQPGGQLTITSDVENYPGFDEPVVGPQLMATMRRQAGNFGTRYKQANVISVNTEVRPFELLLSDQTTIKTHTLIIATGAVAKWLGIKGEEEYQGKGVSACATCDGFFFKNKPIVVIGGGDTALEEATFLTRFAKSVTLIHRRSTLRASSIMVKKAEKNEKIRFQWNSVVKEIKGNERNRVSSIIVEDLKENKTIEIATEGVFVAIGHQPNSDLFKGKLAMNEQGYLLRKQGDTTHTTIPGIFVAGDVSDHRYRQAITAAGMGCQAAIDAQHYLENLS